MHGFCLICEFSYLLIEFAYLLFLLTPTGSRKTLEIWHENDIAVPYDLLMARRDITYVAGSAVLAASGRELGFVGLNRWDFRQRLNTTYKVVIGYFTGRMATVIVNERRKERMDDIWGVRYVGHEGVSYVTPDNAGTEQEGDMYVLMVPWGTARPSSGHPFAVKNPFDITGMWNRARMHPSMSNDCVRELSVPTYPSAFFYRTVYPHLCTLHRNTRPQDERFRDADCEDAVETVCFQGAMRVRRPADGVFGMEILSTAAWGPDVYDGCGHDRAAGVLKKQPHTDVISI